MKKLIGFTCLTLLMVACGVEPTDPTPSPTPTRDAQVTEFSSQPEADMYSPEDTHQHQTDRERCESKTREVLNCVNTSCWEATESCEWDWLEDRCDC